MKKAIILAVLLCYLRGFSQVAINTDGSNPDPSAGLEVKFTNKGFLPPRLTTTQRDAISTPATGLVIFNTTNNRLEYYGGVSAGWAALLSPGSGWSLSGNSGTVDGTNYIGNFDNVPLNFRVSNEPSGRIDRTY
jgi:hypothetical protein